jgi:hypothetical protein
MEWLVDPFNGGELTALQDAEEMLSGLTGMQVSAAQHSPCAAVWLLCVVVGTRAE